MATNRPANEAPSISSSAGGDPGNELRKGGGNGWGKFFLGLVVGAILMSWCSNEELWPEDTAPETETWSVPVTRVLTPTPTLSPQNAKSYMLELINGERVKAGLSPVVQGNNIAAQVHADLGLTNCFSGHWGLDGLKPYMRYSLAGGYQTNAENWLGNVSCIKGSDRFRHRPNDNIRQEIRRAMVGWMSSPGHRQTILYPMYKKVNIGIAWDRYNLRMIQHFEGNYVEFDQVPAIEDGVLVLLGETKTGAQFDSPMDRGVDIYFDPSPSRLTQGQLARTSCYDNGLLIGSLREPLEDGSYYIEDQFTTTYALCPNPAEIPEYAPTPSSDSESFRLWQESHAYSEQLEDSTVTVPWITAREFAVNGNKFSVRADIGEVLSMNGDGVYSIVVWGLIDGEEAVISEYSIFHGVTPPDTYSPGR